MRQLNPDAKGRILCLRPLRRGQDLRKTIRDQCHAPQVRPSGLLGGVREEADIRGHRKTYIGAMPGRIIEA